MSDFVPGLPHAVLIEMREALISYQDHHMLLLILAEDYVAELQAEVLQRVTLPLYASGSGPASVPAGSAPPSITHPVCE